ncbi:MAG: BMP family ABC transporter substrate-binding protein [Lachnospiraceae bacterium]|nr:BMP family ABC transporter substrate-binding protein [Lachnospiraceae bacterium]
MIKKINCFLLIIVISVILAGCGEKDEIALITDIGTVEDGSFNQGVWEGIQRYVGETGKNCHYYKPKDMNDESYMKSIKEAVKGGAKIIVCPGELFGEVIYAAQFKYPKIHFLMIDGTPHNEDYSDETIADNTMAIVFSDEQAGFLAGYAAVKEGYTNLGFLGGDTQEPVIRYGYGFVQGADYAAIEMGTMININYCYGKTFEESQAMKELAASWYQGGTQVIFACAGGMGKSVMKAAEENNGKVIGVDIDQSRESDTVITSAMKHLSSASYLGLSDFYNDSFKGGETLLLDAANDGVGLSMETSRFNNFSDAQYNAIYAQLVDGKLVPYAGTNFGNTFDLTLVNTTVSYQEIKEAPGP